MVFYFPCISIVAFRLRWCGQSTNQKDESVKDFKERLQKRLGYGEKEMLKITVTLVDANNKTIVLGDGMELPFYFHMHRAICVSVHYKVTY